MTRSTFCYIFCGVISVFCVLNHFFYYENIQVSTTDVDDDGNVDPYQVKEKAAKDFKWEEVWAVISSVELLMLAFFYSLNSVCVV